MYTNVNKTTYHFSSFSGNINEAITDRIRTPPTIANDNGDDIWKNGAITIFTPMNARIIAKPYFNLLNM